MRQTRQREIGDAASLRHGEEPPGQRVGGTGGEQVLLLLLLGSVQTELLVLWAACAGMLGCRMGVLDGVGGGFWSWCPAGIPRRNVPGRSCVVMGCCSAHPEGLVPACAAREEGGRCGNRWGNRKPGVVEPSRPPVPTVGLIPEPGTELLSAVCVHGGALCFILPLPHR